MDFQRVEIRLLPCNKTDKDCATNETDIQASQDHLKNLDIVIIHNEQKFN
jgi:hypothetical protein